MDSMLPMETPKPDVRKGLATTPPPTSMITRLNELLSKTAKEIQEIAGTYGYVPTGNAARTLRTLLTGMILAVSGCIDITGWAKKYEIPYKVLHELDPYQRTLLNLPKGEYQKFLYEKRFEHFLLCCRAGISPEEAAQQFEAYGKMINFQDPKSLGDAFFGYPIDLIIRGVDLNTARVCVEKGMGVVGIIVIDLATKQLANNSGENKITYEPILRDLRALIVSPDYLDDEHRPVIPYHLPRIVEKAGAPVVNLVDPCLSYDMLRQLQENCVAPPDDRSCTVIIAPFDDWNGAFRNYIISLFRKHNRPPSDKDAGERVIFMQPEIDKDILGVLDLAKALQKGKLIKTLYICGHGDGRGVAFGDKDVPDRVFGTTDESLMLNILQRLAPGANVYILSCLGGIKEGPAAILSKGDRDGYVTVYGFSEKEGVLFTAQGNMMPHPSGNMKIIPYVAGRETKKVK